MSSSDKPASLPDTLPENPMHWVDSWLREAMAKQGQRNPNSMSIATVGASGQPSSRVVLCKLLVPDPGYLVFYTNYRSRKARELDTNAKAAALFHWDWLGRQIRIEGLVVRSPADESDGYFASRGWGSQLGAWGSDQSEPVDSREALVEQIRKRGLDLGLALRDGTQQLSDGNVPPVERPPHWGGYRLWATDVELWLEGADRIHDRGKWSREVLRGENDAFTATAWTSTRLQP